MKISVISGGFDPIHSGHIAYINAASKFGEKTIILLNSDAWLQKKKKKEFMPFAERKIILESLKNVDEVLGFEDDEIGSCINGLKMIQEKYPNDKIIFCNGGDRNQDNIPEMSLTGIEFNFNVGGADKKNSSSWILKNWQYNYEERIWGKFYDLYEYPGVKVKELIVEPGRGMSFQKHFERNEIWLVSEGECRVRHAPKSNSEDITEITLARHDSFYVKRESWHQIINPFSDICRIIEIQYGAETKEEDIERLHLYNP